MAMDFPSSPTVGQTYTPSGGPSYVWNGSAWVTIAAGSGYSRTVFTAYQGMTVFTANYKPGAPVDVYQNGAKLVQGVDYTAVDGTTVVLANGANANDTVEVVTYPTVTSMTPNPPVGGYRRNRIINGRGRIDQRNANLGATMPTGASYFGDRWGGQKSASGTIGAACTGSAVTWNVTGAQSAPAAADVNVIYQQIEGYNVSDLGWGAAGPSPVTLSFRVYSPLTGTYAVKLSNATGDRSYVATFTVNAANTYERKTITIPGCPDGTWLVNNGIGVQLAFDMGCGSNFNAPVANAWQNGSYFRTAACVTFGTAIRQIYFTDIQLERGGLATEYEWEDYADELARCKRYFEQCSVGFWHYQATTGERAGQTTSFMAEKRAVPTLVGAGAVVDPDGGAAAANVAATNFPNVSRRGFQISVVGGGAAPGDVYLYNYRRGFDAEL